MDPRTDFMREALRLAREPMLAGAGGPFGAVVVLDGRIVGRGSNHVTRNLDPTAHAEVEAIRDACRSLQTFRLDGAELYASCQPCPLCLAAAYWARIGAIYHAASGEQAAAAGFDDEWILRELRLPARERSIPTLPLLSEEGQTPFDLWRAKADRIPY